jgi:hypothetical protein
LLADYGWYSRVVSSSVLQVKLLIPGRLITFALI